MIFTLHKEKLFSNRKPMKFKELVSCAETKLLFCTRYREAVEHFLAALNMQQRGIGPQGERSTMSQNIWSTLRMTISLLGRMDLYKATDDHDLSKLNDEFGVTPVVT